MNQLSEIFELSQGDWLLLALAAIFIGMSKTGFGAGFAAVILIMAHVFGDKQSTGVLVPMLIAADVIAVIYYRRVVKWKYILKLLPWTLIGVGIAVWIGDQVSEEIFGYIMGAIILGGALVMIVLEVRKSELVPDYLWFAALMGLLGGFSTMVGNFAGPVLTVYLLSMRLPKNLFIGTGAWFFFFINIIKVPFHIFVWHTISWQSVKLDLFLVPFIIGGALAGIYIVKLFSDLAYRRLVIAVTILSAFFILF